MPSFRGYFCGVKGALAHDADDNNMIHNAPPLKLCWAVRWIARGYYYGGCALGGSMGWGVSGCVSIDLRNTHTEAVLQSPHMRHFKDSF